MGRLLVLRIFRLDQNIHVIHKKNMKHHQRVELEGLLFIFYYYTLPDSAIVDIGLSGNKIPLSINSSRLARTDILRSRAKNLF